MIRIIDEKVLKSNSYHKTSLLTYEDGMRFIFKICSMDKNAVSRIAQASPLNVVKVFGYTDNSMLTEFVSGRDLTNPVLDVAKMYETILQICDGLIALHGMGIIHRDIKPSNLILGNDGIVRIADLESAVFTGGNAITDKVFRGTGEYAAPEMLNNQPVDHRADIYSLGITISELTGNCFMDFPFQDIIKGCTAFSPNKRFSSVNQIREIVSGYYENLFSDYYDFID